MFQIRKTAEFEAWIQALRDREGRLRIHHRIVRMENGNLGDIKAVGEGVMEKPLNLHGEPYENKT